MPVLLFKDKVASLPPSVNAVWRVGKSGRPYLSQKAAAWKKQATLQFRFKWCGVDEGQPLYREPYKDPVIIMVKIGHKSKRAFDLDNKLKLIQDSIQAAGVIENDSQISMIVSVKTASASDFTEISLWKQDTTPSNLFEDVINGWS